MCTRVYWSMLIDIQMHCLCNNVVPYFPLWSEREGSSLYWKWIFSLFELLWWGGGWNQVFILFLPLLPPYSRYKKYSSLNAQQGKLFSFHLYCFPSTHIIASLETNTLLSSTAAQEGHNPALSFPDTSWFQKQCQLTWLSHFLFCLVW